MSFLLILIETENNQTLLLVSFQLFCGTDLFFNRLFAAGGHVTTATLNQSAMTKWPPETERVG